MRSRYVALWRVGGSSVTSWHLPHALRRSGASAHNMHSMTSAPAYANPYRQGRIILAAASRRLNRRRLRISRPRCF